jgi:hypothetical protein
MRSAAPWLSLVFVGGCFVDALGGGEGGSSSGAGGNGASTTGAETTVSSGGAGPGTTASTGQTGTAASTTGTAGGGGSGDGGGGGEPGPVCGNGVVEAGEQCDAGMGGSPYCNACTVVCDGPYDVLDQATLHCYYDTVDDGMHYSWTASRDWCVTQWGGDHVVINDAAELAFLQGLAPNGFNEDRWIGAHDMQTEDAFVWVDPAVPWTYAPATAPWFGAEPNGGGNEDCVVLRADGLLEEVDCNQGLTHHLCERAPAGL